jgi:hypothetical protein
LFAPGELLRLGRAKLLLSRGGSLGGSAGAWPSRIASSLNDSNPKYALLNDSRLKRFVWMRPHYKAESLRFLFCMLAKDG